MSQLVLAMFHDRDEALSAVDALVDAGFDPTCIGFLAMRPDRFGQLRNPDVVESARQPTSLRAGKGPVADPDDTAVASGLPEQSPGYGLRDPTEFTIPGVGPVLAAGPMVDALRSSPSWPGQRALLDALVRRGIDTSEAKIAFEELERGGILLTVHDGPHSGAREILSRYHPVELQG